MKGNRKQREKEVAKTKTKPPHSIGSTAPAKILNVSKKSQTIQKKPEKSAVVTQRKLISIKNENGTKSLTVSKQNTPIDVKSLNVQATKNGSLVSKSASQVESKVNKIKSPI